MERRWTLSPLSMQDRVPPLSTNQDLRCRCTKYIHCDRAVLPPWSQMHSRKLKNLTRVLYLGNRQDLSIFSMKIIGHISFTHQGQKATSTPHSIAFCRSTCSSKMLQLKEAADTHKPSDGRLMLLTGSVSRILVQNQIWLGEILCCVVEIVFKNTDFGVRKTGSFSSICWSVTQRKLPEVLETQYLISKMQS